MIKTVVFDFVNTIAFKKPYREDILLEYCSREGIVSMSRSEVQKTYFELDEVMPYSSVNIKTKEQKKNFYKRYNEELFRKIKLNHSDRFFDFYHSIEKKWVLDECVCELFKYLKARDISIGIISNFDDHLENVLEDLKIKHIFDFVAISAQIGLEKPDVEFYKYVRRVYNIDINETIYIGDSYNLDYVPSKSAGFNSFLIDRNNVFPKKNNKLQDLNQIRQMVSNVT